MNRRALLRILLATVLVGSLHAEDYTKIQDFEYGYPLEILGFGQDPDDEPSAEGERDFYGGPESLVIRFGEVGTNELGQHVAGEVEGSHPVWAWEAKTVEPPSGHWLVYQTWAVPNQPVVVLHSGGETEGTMVFFHTDGFRELHRIEYGPTPGDGSGDWGFGTTPVAIEPERLYFRKGVPETLEEYFPENAALAENVVWWRDYAHGEEKEAIGKWRVHLEWMLGELKKSESEFVKKEGVALVEEILSAKPMDLPDASAIIGRWKLRSIQGGADTATVYPWFQGLIVGSDRPQELQFGKTGGSQFREGKLLPAQSGHHMVFLGGKSTEFGGSDIYSTIDGTIDSSRSDSDTGGVFFYLEPGRAVMVLDVTQGSWEIYEMLHHGSEIPAE